MDWDWLKNGITKITGQMGTFDDLTKLNIAQEQEKYQKEFLSKVRYNDIDYFHLNGYQTWAKCVKFYDGDSIHLIFFLNGKPFKFRVRLADIDTAEIKSTDPAEKRWAIKALDRLKELIGNDLVYIKCHRWDKYGRLLAHIYANDREAFSFNEILVTEGLAYEYNGGERKPFREWADYQPEIYQNVAENTFTPPKPVDNIGDTEVINETIVQQITTDFDPLTNANHLHDKTHLF